MAFAPVEIGIGADEAGIREAHHRPFLIHPRAQFRRQRREGAPAQLAPAAQIDSAESAEAKAAAAQKRGTEDFKERLYGLDPFVVNVTGDGYNRFLKLRLELEAGDAELKEEIDARLPQVRDALIVLLSSKQLSDITDFEGKALLKEDIRERVNDVLETGSIRSVLFTEFVVQ